MWNLAFKKKKIENFIEISQLLFIWSDYDQLVFAAGVVCLVESATGHGTFDLWVYSSTTLRTTSPHFVLSATFHLVIPRYLSISSTCLFQLTPGLPLPLFPIICASIISLTIRLPPCLKIWPNHLIFCAFTTFNNFGSSYKVYTSWLAFLFHTSLFFFHHFKFVLKVEF